MFPDHGGFNSLEEVMNTDNLVGIIFQKNYLEQEYKGKERFEYSHE